jgi:3-hydroxyacyl-[acyl-carrier-protein] dehydratase
MDIQAIQERINQRYPFLLVDRVVEVEPFVRSVAYKNVTINEAFFAGHFPDNPVMPGVLIIESMSQAGAMMYPKAKNGYIAGIDKVKFLGLVRPGDQLVTEAVNIQKAGAFAKVQVTARVDGKEVARAQITYYMEFEEEKE